MSQETFYEDIRDWAMENELSFIRLDSVEIEKMSEDYVFFDREEGSFYSIKIRENGRTKRINGSMLERYLEDSLEGVSEQKNLYHDPLEGINATQDIEEELSG